MLLTLTTTHSPATDLGYLLHKNPARPQRFDLTFGSALVFYPEATESKCTAALLLEVDPIGLVRKTDGAFALEQYVNDRPYVASSLLSVAIAQVLGTALSGICKQRPELVATPIPLEVFIPTLPSRGGLTLIDDLFTPLGYEVEAAPIPESPCYTLTLKGTQKLSDLLSHLYVLIPVLDNSKHYWVDKAEAEKLLRHGEGWLPAHPLRQLVVERYLKYQKGLQRHATEALEAVAKLEQETPGVEEQVDLKEAAEESVEKPLSLNAQRHEAVVEALKAHGAATVLDLGCAQGKLLRRLLDEKQFTKITGLDVSVRVLETAADRLRLDTMPEARRKRIELLHGSLTYRDRRLEGFDAACLVEVIEHLDPPRLSSLERVLFQHARPRTILVTTPNVEYNVRFPTLPPGKLRHGDHRFEWTRAEFQTWAESVASKFGYNVTFAPIGQDDPEVGPPTQMAVFTLGGGT